MKKKSLNNSFFHSMKTNFSAKVSQFGQSSTPLIEVPLEHLKTSAQFLATEQASLCRFLLNFVVQDRYEELVLSYFLGTDLQNVKLVLRTSYHFSNAEDIEASLLKPISCPSLRRVWRQIIPFENEMSVLFGICFDGKSASGVCADLLPTQWKSFPMRKNYLFPNV